MTDHELWLPIPGHDPYIVSDAGRVARLRIPSPTSKGYMKLNLGRVNGIQQQVYVHQLVMLAFNGPPPAGHNVDHWDFDRSNNARTNLRYLPEPINSWRWKVHEQDIDPAELDRINAEYEALEAGTDIPTWQAS